MSLQVEKLNVRYGKSHVVFDLDVKVEPGEVLALLGRNGAGKTTTIKGILGLLPGTSGNVTIDDRNVSRWPAWRRCRAGMAYVPSGARCFPNLTVQENLDIPRRSSPDSWNKKRVYDLFPKLSRLSGTVAASLSGGERQMLAVGRALMSNPRAILLDEPTEGLAPVVVQELTRLVRTLKDSGVAVLLAEQNHQMALRCSDRAAFMEKGRIVEVLHRVLGI